jgi:hypothetical protein
MQKTLPATAYHQNRNQSHVCSVFTRDIQRHNDTIPIAADVIAERHDGLLTAPLLKDEMCFS